MPLETKTRDAKRGKAKSTSVERRSALKQKRAGTKGRHAAQHERAAQGDNRKAGSLKGRPGTVARREAESARGAVASRRGGVANMPADAETFWGGGSLARLNGLDPLQMVDIVRAGVSADLLPYMAKMMAISMEHLYRIVGLPRATADRKVRAHQRLDASQSERALGLAQLVAQVEQIMEESGDPEAVDFSPAQWVAGWLDRPNPALGGREPGGLMDTAHGRAIVSRLVAQMQSGAYA